MKRCNACQEEFADKFSFCPVDGSPLNSQAAALVGKEAPGDSYPREFVSDEPLYDHPAAQRPDFKLTMISTAGLGVRLAAEFLFVIDQLRQAWPDFKRDPIGVGRRAAIGLARAFRAMVLQPNALAGVATAIVLVLSVVLTLILSEWKLIVEPITAEDREEVVQIFSLSLPGEPPKPEGSGVGVGANGRVGLANGKGEGSESEPKSSRGGGSGGNQNQLLPQQGKVPPPSDIPAPISPPLPNPSLPAAGVDLDPALWKNLPFVAYGDPRSKSTVASTGPGDGGGIGTNKGLGVGDGSGNGFGPGEDGNTGGGKKDRGGNGPGGADGNYPDSRHVYRLPEVTQRAKVISKPEPQYTEAARKNQVTGSVVLSVVFSQSGEVISIRAVKTLPDGLTERAIAAARQIRFVPAVRNGQPVSVYMQLEYNFNLY
jgi:TonB family protein